LFSSGVKLEFWIWGIFWTPQVAHQDNGSPAVQQVLNSWQCGLNTAVIGDLPIGHRDVEIDPNQDTLVFDIDIFYGFLFIFCFLSLTSY
jgi:hypothetical protein